MVPTDFQILAGDKPCSGDFLCSRCDEPLPYGAAPLSVEWRDIVFRYCVACSAPPPPPEGAP